MDCSNPAESTPHITLGNPMSFLAFLPDIIKQTIVTKEINCPMYIRNWTESTGSEGVKIVTDITWKENGILGYSRRSENTS